MSSTSPASTCSVEYQRTTRFERRPCAARRIIEGTGDLRYEQTKAFTTLMPFQIFNARSDEQSAFLTVDLSAGDWGRCALVASSVLWTREASKIVTRIVSNRTQRAQNAIPNTLQVLAKPVPVSQKPATN